MTVPCVYDIGYATLVCIRPATFIMYMCTYIYKYTHQGRSVLEFFAAVIYTHIFTSVSLVSLCKYLFKLVKGTIL
jgi:hypothetical protein